MRGRTYRFFNGTPLYSFGYGLSYSTFRFSGLHVKQQVGSHEKVRVSGRVANTSTLDGDEVVQVYVSREQSAKDAPIRELRGFQRIHLAAGESREVKFDLDLPNTTPGDALAAHGFGHFRISIGGGQPDGEMPFVDAVF